MIAEFPLLVFTVLTGLSAGSYVMATVFDLLQGHQKRSFAFDVICLACLGMGMLGVLVHLGHPERFLNALANPSAMITQEAYWSLLFGIVLLVDALLIKAHKCSGKALPVVISLFGCGLMVVTSIAYFTSYGRVAWAQIPTLFLFIVGDLALGAAFTTAFLKVERAHKFVVISCVLYAVICITFIAEAVVFSKTAVGPTAFIVAAIVAGIGAVLEGGQLVAKRPRNLEWLIFCLVCLSVVIARYAFYAVG